nr:hypothetical protein CFP56_01218 [Quercus suber]
MTPSLIPLYGRKVNIHAMALCWMPGTTVVPALWTRFRDMAPGFQAARLMKVWPCILMTLQCMVIDPGNWGCLTLSPLMGMSSRFPIFSNEFLATLSRRALSKIVCW